MTTVAPALQRRRFDENLTQVTACEAYCWERSEYYAETIMTTPVDEYDGCALIHRLAWPKVGTMGCVCETFVGYVLASAAPDVQVCVVFDCYDQQTTKAPEQKWRRLKTGSYPDVVLEDNTSVSARKQGSISWQHG